MRRLLSYATSEHKVDQEYEKYIQSLKRRLYGFELKGEIVGCIGIELNNSNGCEIKHIVVSPVRRVKGIGSKMIKFGCEKHSLIDKGAVDFYRSMNVLR
ncbi:GNAT family N-acetyltransferase [Bacillus sp. F19]|nr:GNAT family N-acetyltransferase [Bacillus sp. F19]